jgi:lysozyme family protein
MTAFDQAFEKTLGVEGGFSDNPADSGGKTRFGITERLAVAHGYSGDMRVLPFEFAKGIYKTQFWDILNLDAIAGLSLPVALEVFDTAVNCSPGFAGTTLQRSLNALNRGATDFGDVEPDGLVGAITVAALRAYLAKRGKSGETVLLRALNSLQGARYVDLAEKRPKDEAFVFGWFLNRVEV